MTKTKLNITPKLAELLAKGDKPQTFTPPPPEPEPQHLEPEYHHEEGHDTRDVLATTLGHDARDVSATLTRVLARVCR